MVEAPTKGGWRPIKGSGWQSDPDIDRARMLPHLRDAYRIPRSPWVRDRALEMSAALGIGQSW